MTDKPIIFSGPMVRALLEGRKTQTRRILKPQPDTTSDPSGRGAWGSINRYGYWLPVAEIQPYAVGDRLWVREALVNGSQLVYAADDEVVVRPQSAWNWTFSQQKIPSIHMPRWASRITLTVTAVKVEQLHDISEEDARAEGVERLKSGRGYSSAKHGHAAVHFGVYHAFAKEAFKELWNTIHGPDAWQQNPWIVAVSFAPVKATP